MLAMQLRRYRDKLEPVEIAIPEPGADEVLLRVLACGVCRTDLHIADGELKKARLPIIPGHEIVGVVEQVGPDVNGLSTGDLVGVPWLARTCGSCRFCLCGKENLCNDPLFTGYTKDGGYAEYATAYAQYCFRLPKDVDVARTAPMLCAGLIGWRALKLAGHGERLGIYGFGASGHIVAQIAFQQGRKVYAFTRKGDTKTQQFAMDLGATWAGDSHHAPPDKLDAAIIFAPDGTLVARALQTVDKGGTVICAGIHMSDLPPIPYSMLWEERSIKSVANLTRADGTEFFEMLGKLRINTSITKYPLAKASQALDDLRQGRFEGAAVLIP